MTLGPLFLSTLYRGIFHLFNNLEDSQVEYKTVDDSIRFLILSAQLYFPGILYSGISFLETKQNDTCYGQTLICLPTPKALSFSISNWLLMADLTLHFSLTPLHHQLTGSHWTLVDMVTLSKGHYSQEYLSISFG